MVVACSRSPIVLPLALGEYTHGEGNQSTDPATGAFSARHQSAGEGTSAREALPRTRGEKRKKMVTPRSPRKEMERLGTASCKATCFLYFRNCTHGPPPYKMYHPILSIDATKQNRFRSLGPGGRVHAES